MSISLHECSGVIETIPKHPVYTKSSVSQVHRYKCFVSVGLFSQNTSENWQFGNPFEW